MLYFNTNLGATPSWAAAGEAREWPLRIRQVKGMGRLSLDTILNGVFESLAR